MNVLKIFRAIDFPLLLATISLTILGILTIFPIGDVDTTLFYKQILFLGIGIVMVIGIANIDLSFLRNGKIVLLLYGLVAASMIGLLFFGQEINGAKSWYILGSVVVQPVEFAKLVIILLLAKYFTHRHIAIGYFKHIFISLVYVGIIFVLTIAQPDLGSAIIIAFMWLGFVVLAGMSKKHLLVLSVIAIFAGLVSWNVIPTYQQERIQSFLTPEEDLSGVGYNAYQSKIAIGSGELVGKGLAQGTQSKLAFLPEYETDFIFSAYGEEWGFIGILILFFLYGVMFTRILGSALKGETNFEILFMVGVALYILIQSSVHIGVNTGLLPVTGTSLPFVSYGGSHLIIEYILIGMIMSMKHRGGVINREDKNEINDIFHG